MRNTLYYGDNLNILREHVKDNSVDLIYLDPPFNSNRSYNVLFKDESGHEAESQITAFEDTWHWNTKAEETYQELVTHSSAGVSNIINALRQSIGTNQMMAYLVMMAARLVELHRVLKPTGSLYLHCDPTASHYLKIVMDAIFGPENFQNEIVWHYKRWPAKQKNFQSMHDIILFYSKMGRQNTFNVLLEPLSPGTLKRWKGKKSKVEYIDDVRLVTKMTNEESPGRPMDDVWNIPVINSQAAERLGYPTQKPIALLERIIQASSNPNDLVLDPFCGCGTTIAAAQKLGRCWIGIDITHLSIALQKYRLKDMFGLVEKKDYDVKGEPEDVQSAQQLAHDDRYQFQWWALSLVKARPINGGSKEGKKGSDKGIDGVIAFIDDATRKSKRVLVQVKSGKVKSGDIRDLRGVIEREDAAMGVFITLEEPSRDMVTEAVSTGFYHSLGWNKDYPRLQILTIADLLSGASVQMPPLSITFKQAEEVKADAPKQQGFF